MSENAKDETLGLERLVFFSDAVFAIAITLLILDVKPPGMPKDAQSGDLVEAVIGLIPNLVGYLVSFLVVGSMWIEHHRIFRYIGNYSEGLLWRNLVLLLTVGLMPFPTALFSQNHTLGSGLAIYAGCLAMVGLSKVWVWRYAASGHRLLRQGVSDDVVRKISRRSWAVPVTCTITMIMGAFDVPMAYLSFAFIPLFAWMFDKMGRSKH